MSPAPIASPRSRGVADGRGDDIVVNVQGDEPLLPPALIGQVAGLLAATPGAAIATLATPILSEAEYLDPNVVKVVARPDGMALYFSRAPIPWDRDGAAQVPPQPAGTTAAAGTSGSTRIASPRSSGSRPRRPPSSSGANGSSSCARSPWASPSSSRMRRSCRAPASTRRRTSRARMRSCGRRGADEPRRRPGRAVLRGRDQPHRERARAAGPARHPHGSRPALGRRAGIGDRCRASRARRLPAGLLGERGARRTARAALPRGLRARRRPRAHRADDGRVRGARARDVGPVQPRRPRRRAAAGLSRAPQCAACARPRAGRVRLQRRHALPADGRDGGRARPGAGRPDPDQPVEPDRIDDPGPGARRHRGRVPRARHPDPVRRDLPRHHLRQRAPNRSSRTRPTPSSSTRSRSTGA